MFLVLMLLLLNTHLHILRERKETLKLQKQFLWCNLCVPFGHTHVAMPQHLAHRFYRYALFKGNECGKGMPCRMCGKGKSYTLSKAQCFKIRLIGGILHLWQQRFPFFASILLYYPNRFGQQLNTAKYTCLVAVEL